MRTAPRARWSGAGKWHIAGPAIVGGVSIPLALYNTAGNVAGVAAGYVTGWLKDFSGDYYLPLFLVGGFMLMSAALMLWLANRSNGREAGQGQTLAGVHR